MTPDTMPYVWGITGLLTAGCILLIALLVRRSPGTQDGGQSAVSEELRSAREESRRAARELREEVSQGLGSMSSTVSETLAGIGELQKNELQGVSDGIQKLIVSNQNSIAHLRTTIDERLKTLQEGNEKKLDEMRKTVDEKLHDTLEKRLGESFKIVSQRLEAVQRGLGEMKSLADGVGDLKRVLTNVKTRGTWGEVQLGAILENILTGDQYEKNVRTKEGSGDSVEYAIRLPGLERDPKACVWLPIDSKFPQEDYLRLMEASETADAEGVRRASQELGRTVRKAAKDIAEKYLDPPRTTDFGVMFLPTEGLYAEVLRYPGLIEELQQTYRVTIAGPTTLAAFLNSLQLGFRTIAIEQSASEVWKVLAAVKTEFGKFGGVLEKVKRHLNTASSSIEKTSVRTRAMERRLRDVEQLSYGEAEKVLELPGPEEDSEEDGEDPAEDPEEE
jgi:DNA recombination protein RmuC